MFSLHVPSRLLALVLLAVFATGAWATASFNTADKWNAVTTFQSIGLYWQPTGGGTSQKASVRFKPEGTTTWRDGHELWWDDRNSEYRGSLVELQSDTTYEIQLKLGTGGWVDTTTNCDAGASNCVIPPTATCTTTTETRCTRTWSESFPIGQIFEIDAGTTHLAISASQSGTASGYTLFRPKNVPGGGVIDMTGIDPNTAGNETGSCVEIQPGTRYIIVRDLVLKNCARHGIVMQWRTPAPTEKTHHIVIEGNSISGWGRRIPGALPERDDGINCNFFNETRPDFRVDQFIVQRNRIFNPRHRTASWAENPAHANGPRGMHFERCGGTNHVIRFNELWADNLDPTDGLPVGFEDAIGGAENFGQGGHGGFPWADSDIYGNYLANAYDDAIEAEGENRNVRIWNNYMESVYVALGNATTSKGPLYVWRNISNKMAHMRDPRIPNPDTETDRGGFIKGGGDSPLNGGRAYYYHNTILQPPPEAGSQQRFGANEGIGDSAGAGRLLFNFVSRNNVWHVWKGSGASQLSNARSVRTGTLPNNGLSDTQRRSIVANGDLYNGTLAGLPTASETPEGTITAGGIAAEPNGIRAVPTYASGRPGFPDHPNSLPSDRDANGDRVFAGNFGLASGTPGTSNVRLIPNFNDLDGTPHVGAQRSNQAQMKFGRLAAGDPPPPPLCPQPPTASFTATPPSGDAPLPVDFDASASSAVSPATIAGYAWTFGDGDSGTGVTTSHIYQTPGARTARLVVTDSNNCQSAPNDQVITANDPNGGGTVTLMQGLNGYLGTTDTQIASALPTTNRGEELGYELVPEINTGILIRFAIFQSEGGPVPNNATVTSATLSLYKFFGAASTFKASRLLKNWNESQATWNIAATGLNWSTAGARGSGTDYLATPDGQASVNDNGNTCLSAPFPAVCWLHINVTSGVQAFKSGTSNFGWKIAYVSGANDNSHKEFNSSEYDRFPDLRPKLTVTYTLP